MSETFAESIKSLEGRVDMLQAEIKTCEEMNEDARLSIEIRESRIAAAKQRIDDIQGAIRLLKGAFDSE